MISPAPRSGYSQFTFSPFRQTETAGPASVPRQRQMFLFPAVSPPLLASSTWSLPRATSPRSGGGGRHLFCPLLGTPARVCCVRPPLTLHGKNESAGKFFLFLLHGHLQFSAAAASLSLSLSSGFPSAAAAGSVFFTCGMRELVHQCLSAYLHHGRTVELTCGRPCTVQTPPMSAESNG